MSPWLIPTLATLAGFAGLLWSAERFVGASAGIAQRLGVSPLVIGMTVVAFGTSAPEILVSISASLRQAGELAVGNALGSNLANMGLVLGATALFAPLPVERHLLRRELPLLLAVTALAGLFLSDVQLHAWEGWVLLAALPPSLWLLMQHRARPPGAELAALPATNIALPGQLLWFTLGLAALIASSEVLVWGAQKLALLAGVSPLVVGLTVIAIGTSLPELATSIAGALKGEMDIALGNIIGSNVFNLLAVMAIPALVHQPIMEPAVFSRDALAMGLVTLLLAGAIALATWRRARGARLGRLAGTALLIAYAVYLSRLV